MRKARLSDRQTKLQRAAIINELVRCIGGCGHRYFYCERKDRYAVIEVDLRGRVWWIDDLSGRRIYTHCSRGGWEGFTHGGTLKSLVVAFKDYISQGKLLGAAQLGPWPPSVCNCDLWAYGEDMEVVREKARALSLMKNPTTRTNK